VGSLPGGKQDRRPGLPDRGQAVPPPVANALEVVIDQRGGAVGHGAQSGAIDAAPASTHPDAQRRRCQDAAAGPRLVQGDDPVQLVVAAARQGGVRGPRQHQRGAIVRAVDVPADEALLAGELRKQLVESGDQLGRVAEVRVGDEDAAAGVVGQLGHGRDAIGDSIGGSIGGTWMDAATSDSPRMPRQPNILILLTDQQSHDLMSCAGTPWLATPHLDRLAAGGTRFTRAYCSDPVCVPSRFSMFTGRMPSAIGMRGNGGKGLHPFTVEDDASGLGHCLRRAGYRTWYGGKVHWPIDLTPERLGFTTFCADERERLAVEAADLIQRQGPDPWAMVVSLINPHDICLNAIRSFARADDKTWDHHILAKALVELANLDEALLPPPGADPADWIERHCPPLPANHAAQQDEPELIGAVLARRPFKQRARAQWGAREWRLHRWAYARLMERVDRQIGVVLAALAASGQADDTLVIMTSDHGDHAGSHRLEHKTFFYDEAARVPWLMRLPGRIPAGKVEEHALVATGLDLLATCCDAAGVAVPAICRGQSLLPVLDGPTAGRTHVYAENIVSRMVVTAAWKYVRYDGGAHAEQLYDLVNDPGETRNHAADPRHAGTLDNLRVLLQAEQAAHAALAKGPEVAGQAAE